MHKKKGNNAFKFLQAIVFIYDVYIYKMCRINKEKRKKSYETYSFVWKMWQIKQV